MRRAENLLRDKRGATAIEYGLIAALVSIGAIVAMQGVGDQIGATFNTTSEAMSGGSSTNGGNNSGDAGRGGTAGSPSTFGA